MVETRDEQSARRLAMLAGGGTFRLPVGGPDTSGQAWRPYDVAHAMGWIRGIRRRQLRLGEHEPLPEDDERNCRLSELLLSAIYVDDWSPGSTVAHLFVHLIQRAREMGDVERNEAQYRLLAKMAEAIIEELKAPQLCMECRGHGQVPEWRAHELTRFQVPDKTRTRLVDCPRCGGFGLAARSDWRRYSAMGVGHETYERRWRALYERLFALCLERIQVGLQAVGRALVRQTG